MGSQASFSEQAGNEIGAAGGGALEKHHAQGAAHDHASEDAPQNGLHRLKGVKHVENIDENGGDEHGVKGGHQQVPAQQLPPQQEQGMFRMMTTVPMGAQGRMWLMIWPTPVMPPKPIWLGS